MAGIFAAQGALASRRPKTAIAIVLLLTGVFAFGMTLTGTASGDQTESFLPPGSDLAQAQERIQADFGARTAIIPVQLLVRADNVLEPTALREALELSDLAAEEAGSFIVGTPFGYAQSIALLMGGTIPADATLADVQAALAYEGNATSLLQLAASANSLISADRSAGLIVVNIDGDESLHSESELADVQLGMEAAVRGGNQVETSTHTFSEAKMLEEMLEAQGTSTNVLMVAALGIIVLVLVLFYRTGSDVLVSLSGLVITIIWVFGLQGFLGPKGLDVIGADNPLALMIPVLLIGLTVDYALQITGRYREDIAGGANPKAASFEAVKHSGMPLLLAAGTTMIAFMTNLTSSLPPIQDFGIISGVGVMLGFIVMITFVPAVRNVLDQRRIAKRKPLQSRAMADAIPGVGKFLGKLANIIVRRPLVVLGIVGVISVGSFVGAANVSTTFSQTDFLPTNTESFQDLTLLGEEFGGGSAMAQVLIEGDFLDPAQLVTLIELEFAINNETTRPEGATGMVRSSLFVLIADFADDSGLPGDRFDQGFFDLISQLALQGPDAISRADVQGLYDVLGAAAGDELGAVLVLHDGAPDSTILTIPMVSGDASATRAFQSDLRELWSGDADSMFITGTEILTVAVTDEMTEGQLQSVALTIVAAVIVLMIFFGYTEKRPALGVITVLPIALVVGWILGTMYLLGISYNVMTALITALTIGVGVDYTIHITHRFLEELAEKRGIRHAVAESMRTTGGALIGSALTTALGFGVLVFSPLAPMQQFGGLTALTILFSLIASFIVLPPMLVLWALYQSWRTGEATTDIKPTVVGTDPIVIGGNQSAAGALISCPECLTKTFVPASIAGIRCPNRTCSYEADNPAFATVGR